LSAPRRRPAVRGGLALAAAGAACLTLTAAAAGQPAITTTEGQGFSGQVATVSTDCNTLSPGSESIDWGDPTGDISPGQATVSGSQLVISGSHTYVEEGQYAGTVSGSYSCNGRGTSFTASFSAQIADAPVYLSGGLQLTASASDQSFSGRVATISSAEAPSSYTAKIDWGDGSSSTGTIAACGGTFCVGTDYVSGSHQYPRKPGTYTITVTVLDDGGQSASVKDTITVGQPSPCPALSSYKWGGPYSQPPYTVGNEFQLSSPQPIVDQNGNQTGQYSETLWVLTGGIAAVTPSCWYPVGDAGPPATGEAFYPTVHFLTYSGVAINGVYFIPESPDSLLVLGTDGTLVAENVCGLLPIKGVRAPSARAHAAGCSRSTYYDIEVPENGPQGGPLTTVGRVDLRAHPITNFSTSLAAPNSIEPAPGGPQIGTHQINPGATIKEQPYPAQYAAEVDAQINLPGEFSQIQGNGVPGANDEPSNGQPVTSQLTYYTQGPTPGGGSSGGGGGGGSSSGNNPCLGITPRPPSCTPVAQERGHGTRVPAGRSTRPDSWDAAAPTHATRVRAHQANASACPPVDLSTAQLFLGGLHILDASLTCDASGWTGSGELDFSEIPGGQSLPNAGITFHLSPGGSFEDGSAQLTFSPALPVFATPPVALNSLNIAIATHPTDFAGQASVDILGGLVHINGGVLVVNADQHDPYTYDVTSCKYQHEPCPPLPGINSLQWTGPITTFAAGVGGTVDIGDVPVLGTIQLASGYVFYIYPSYLEFAGHLGPITLGPVSAGADLQGAFDTSKGQYDASGDLYGCMDWPIYGNTCISLAGEVSNVGVGACIGGTKAHGCSPVCVGFTYTWSGSFNLNVALRGSGCDFGPIVVQVHSVRRAVAARAGSAVGFDLPRGLSGADVYVHGSGGPPRIELTGPHGEHLSNPGIGQSARSSDSLIWPLPQLDETMIAIANPSAGRWTVTPLAGSPPIIGLAFAKQLPAASISAGVSGKGRAFTLRYHVRKEAGQTVQFVERGRGVFHVLGRTTGGRGTLRFPPALGPAGAREIVAVIAENRLPVRTLVVGRYKAPPIPRAARVRHLRIARTRRALVVTWDAAANAHGYLVTANLTDGRGLSFTQRGRRLSIRTLGPGTGALVTVYGIGPTGQPGASATARLTPPPPPTRVARIAVHRTHRGLVISWRRSSRAIRYMLKLTISGVAPATLYAFTDRPTLTLLRDAPLMLARGASTEIQIRAVSVEGQQGPAGTLRYRAKGRPPRRRHSPMLELFD
jgi:hypothetical protein